MEGILQQIRRKMDAYPQLVVHRGKEPSSVLVRFNDWQDLKFRLDLLESRLVDLLTVNEVLGRERIIGQEELPKELSLSEMEHLRESGQKVNQVLQTRGPQAFVGDPALARELEQFQEKVLGLLQYLTAPNSAADL